jgi:hypothetical protein
MSPLENLFSDLWYRHQEGDELEGFLKAMLTINLLWFVYGFSC